MTFSNTMYDNIFSDFLVSTNIDVSLDKLKDEIYEIKILLKIIRDLVEIVFKLLGVKIQIKRNCNL